MNRSDAFRAAVVVSSDLSRTRAGEVGRQKPALPLGLSNLPTTTGQTAHMYMGAHACALAQVRNMSIYARQGREVGQKQSLRGFRASSLFEFCPTTTDGYEVRGFGVTMEDQMQMIGYVHERLTRWAQWSAREGLVRGLWYARCSLAQDSGVAPVGDVALDQEASDTEVSVMRLPDDLRKAVIVFYLGRGTREQKARDCGCASRTLHSRVCRAQQRLAGIIGDVRAEREKWPFACSFAKRLDGPA